MIPQDIVCEFLGGISFSKDEEKDVAIAEQIASNTYNSMDDLIGTCKGFIETKSKLEAFEAYIIDCKSETNTFFHKYFNLPQN